MSHRRYRVLTMTEVELWPSLDPLALDLSFREDFIRKRVAILQYAQGVSLKDIQKDTGVSRQHLHYLLDRCRWPASDGRLMGFRALLKGRHLPSNRRHARSKLDLGRPTPGALSALFAKFPSLERVMYLAVMEGRDPHSHRAGLSLNWAQLQDIFHTECISLGIRAPSYPFCSESQGVVALRRWVNRLRRHEAISSTSVSAFDLCGQDATPVRCYKRVELDGHSLDISWTLTFKGLKGEGILELEIFRLWLIALLEVPSGAVLGYSIGFGRNYSSDDVTRAILSSLVPWRPRNLTISTIAYRPGECLPNAYVPELAYVCFDELHMDNAKSQLSELLLCSLEQTVNAVPVFGPRAAPDARPNIEMLFSLLEEAGIHPLDCAIDSPSHSRDSSKKRSGKARYVIDYESLCDVVDILICRYNSGKSPGSSISRLEILRRSAQQETHLVRRVPAAKREDLARYDIYDIATIGQDDGKALIRWKNARYTSSTFKNRVGLVGERVLVKANSKDLRTIDISLLETGMPLGELVIEKRYRSTAHTLWARQQACREMQKDSFIRSSGDIPRAVRSSLEAKHKLTQAQKRALARLVIEQQKCAETDGPLGQDDEVVESVVLPSVPNHTDRELEDIDKVLAKVGSIYR